LGLIVTAPRHFERQFRLCLVIVAALLCALSTGPAAASDDDFDDFTDEVIRQPAPQGVVMLGAAQQQPAGLALRYFNQVVLGSRPGEHSLHDIIQARTLAVDLICDGAPGLARKLELAGRGDIIHLRDRVDELRKEFQLVDDRGERQVPAELAQRASALRAEMESGLLEERSLFSKTLRHTLNARQWALYAAFHELDIRGGKAQLRIYGDRKVKVIRMTNAALTDEGLVHFKPLPHLRGVLLDYTQVTDDGLAHLAGLTNLEVLDLGSTQVRGEGLLHLANMRCLQYLDLRRTPFTDAGLVHLRNLTGLRFLNLGHTRVTGTGFAHLSGLSNLETILLHQTPFTDEGLSHLLGLANLKTLVLEGTQITDAGLAHLARLPSLETLNLRRVGMTDKGLSHLRSLTSLQTLDLYDTDVSETAIDELKKALPRLTVVK